MFVALSITLGALVAAQVFARLAQGRFEEFRGLPRMQQDG